MEVKKREGKVNKPYQLGAKFTSSLDVEEQFFERLAQGLEDHRRDHEEKGFKVATKARIVSLLGWTTHGGGDGVNDASDDAPDLKVADGEHIQQGIVRMLSP